MFDNIATALGVTVRSENYDDVVFLGPNCRENARNYVKCIIAYGDTSWVHVTVRFGKDDQDKFTWRRTTGWSV